MNNHPVLHVGYDLPAPRTPQEIVERLCGSTTYREPFGAVGGRPEIANDDIAFELAHARDRDKQLHSRLARALALSVATANAGLWPEVHEYGVPHLLHACGESRVLRTLVVGQRKIRIRIVLWDAFHALTKTATQRPVSARARMAHMRRTTYETLYEFVFSEISNLADAVMADACEALRSARAT